MKRLICVTCLVTLFGCGIGWRRTEYLTPLMPVYSLPDSPRLPVVSATETAVLPDDVWERLAVREALRAEYSRRLRAILEEHNDWAKAQNRQHGYERK